MVVLSSLVDRVTDGKGSRSVEKEIVIFHLLVTGPTTYCFLSDEFHRSLTITKFND